MNKSKVMGVDEAVRLIRDGDTVVATAGGLVGYPEYLAKGIERRYQQEQLPKGLTVVAGGGHGTHDERGDSRFGHPGLLRRYIGSHPNTIPAVRKMIENNEAEGYVLPQGILNQLFRAGSARQPGVLSKIGVGTYIDPRQEGGRINSAARDDLVEVVELLGEEWLFYKAIPIDVALIRATTADTNGNLTIEQEALKLELLEVALAARATGGKVIAQVKTVAAAGSLDPKSVVVPGTLVDAVVVVEEPTVDHLQTNGTYYNPYFSGETKAPAPANAQPKERLDAEDVITRRAVFELFPGAVTNLGIGIGAGVGQVAAEEGVVDRITFTVELGVFGGTPLPIPDFGAVLNPESYLAPPSMFDFYHGGGLDITFLGAAQVDKKGNVNVSKFNGRAAGQGGFIDISQTSRKIVFCTFLKAKSFKGGVAGGKLEIEQEGLVKKFVDTVDQITFSGDTAVADGREVLFITERAVFRLTKYGVVLEEIAPGVDLERDVLGQMDFKPLISDSLKTMDARIFTPGKMNCLENFNA